MAKRERPKKRGTRGPAGRDRPGRSQARAASPSGHDGVPPPIFGDGVSDIIPAKSSSSCVRTRRRGSPRASPAARAVA